jgi:class 3 adenylate cyclase
MLPSLVAQCKTDSNNMLPIPASSDGTVRQAYRAQLRNRSISTLPDCSQYLHSRSELTSPTTDSSSSGSRARSPENDNYHDITDGIDPDEHNLASSSSSSSPYNDEETLVGGYEMTSPPMWKRASLWARRHMFHLGELLLSALMSFAVIFALFSESLRMGYAPRSWDPFFLIITVGVFALFIAEACICCAFAYFAHVVPSLDSHDDSVPTSKTQPFAWRMWQQRHTFSNVSLETVLDVIAVASLLPDALYISDVISLSRIHRDSLLLCKAGFLVRLIDAIRWIPVDLVRLEQLWNRVCSKEWWIDTVWITLVYAAKLTKTYTTQVVTVFLEKDASQSIAFTIAVPLRTPDIPSLVLLKRTPRLNVNSRSQSGNSRISSPAHRTNTSVSPQQSLSPGEHIIIHPHTTRANTEERPMHTPDSSLLSVHLRSAHMFREGGGMVQQQQQQPAPFSPRLPVHLSGIPSASRSGTDRHSSHVLPGSGSGSGSDGSVRRIGLLSTASPLLHHRQLLLLSRSNSMGSDVTSVSSTHTGSSSAPRILSPPQSRIFSLTAMSPIVSLRSLPPTPSASISRIISPASDNLSPPFPLHSLIPSLTSATTAEEINVVPIIAKEHEQTDAKIDLSSPSSPLLATVMRHSVSFSHASHIGQLLSNYTAHRTIMGLLLVLFVWNITHSLQVDDRPQIGLQRIQHKLDYLGESALEHFAHFDTAVNVPSFSSSPILPLVDTYIRSWGSDLLYLRIGRHVLVHSEAAIAVLRPEEISHLSTRVCESMHNHRHYSQQMARFDLYTMAWLVVMLPILLYVVYNDVRNVVMPIERMVSFVASVAHDPLSSQLGIMLSSNDSHSPKLTSSFVDQALQRLVVLLRVGYGTAGSEIIASNIKGDMMNPMIPGRRVYAIFGFCDIGEFNRHTEVLEEAIMAFVNQIAAIVHQQCTHFGGTVNKNVGPSFLLVWKFDTEDMQHLKQVSSSKVHSSSHTVRETLQDSQASVELTSVTSQTALFTLPDAPVLSPSRTIQHTLLEDDFDMLLERNTSAVSACSSSSSSYSPTRRLDLNRSVSAVSVDDDNDYNIREQSSHSGAMQRCVSASVLKMSSGAMVDSLGRHSHSSSRRIGSRSIAAQQQQELLGSIGEGEIVTENLLTDKVSFNLHANNALNRLMKLDSDVIGLRTNESNSESISSMEHDASEKSQSAATQAGVESKASMSPSPIPVRTAVHRIANQALTAFLSTILRISTDSSMLRWRFDSDLQARMKSDYIGPEMGFGLHVGWAIEGAIGSAHKIDASYLSPNVNMAARLCTATRQYRVPILFSGAFYNLLDRAIQRRCRHLDRVLVKGSSQPIDLYTFDISSGWREMAVDGTLKEASTHYSEMRTEWMSQMNAIRFNSMPKRRGSVPAMAEVASGEGSSVSPAQQQQQHQQQQLHTLLAQLQCDLPDNYVSLFNRGIKSYIAGNWSAAGHRLVKFQSLHLERVAPLSTVDGPSSLILRFMGQHAFQTPIGWTGSRKLDKK